MPYLITYRDFKGRLQRRSYGGPETKARGAAIRRADCAQLLKVEPITAAEPARAEGSCPKRKRAHNLKGSDM